MIDKLTPSGAFQQLTSHIPPAQFSRYALVGIWNTLFGYGTYAGLTALLTPHIAHAYIVAAIASSVLNITVAFLGYKWFVFKTKRNYLREWLRCIFVYGTTALVGVVVLPVVVLALRHFARLEHSAPYLGGAAVMGLSVIASFLGNKKFSFAAAPKPNR